LLVRITARIVAFICDENASLRSRLPQKERKQRMQKRRRFTHTSSLAERLLCDTRHLRELAEELPPGPAQNEVHRKIRQNETAAHISEWLQSPGLQAPQ